MSAEGERTVAKKDEDVDNKPTIQVEYKPRIKLLDLGVQIFIHVGCVYGIYLAFTQAKLLTTLWGK